MTQKVAELLDAEQNMNVVQLHVVQVFPTLCIGLIDLSLGLICIQ